MLNDERKNELLQIISEAEYITVEELSTRLYISPSTIRRNLTELERMGYVKRSYGGVELCDDSHHAPLRLRAKKNHLVKNQIARLAAQRIQDNSVIFLDGSSSCLHMVPYLSKRKGITIYTNGLELCSLLAETDIPTYCLGGTLLPRSLAFAGEQSIIIAKSLYFDALFFSCGGLAGDLVMDYSQAEANLRSVLLEQSNKQYLLCDSSKIGKYYPYIICHQNDLTEVLTDSQPFDQQSSLEEDTV